MEIAFPSRISIYEIANSKVKYFKIYYKEFLAERMTLLIPMSINISLFVTNSKLNFFLLLSFYYILFYSSNLETVS